MFPGSSDRVWACCQSPAFGTYETSGLSGIGSAFEVKPDTGPPFAEVRV